MGPIVDLAAVVVDCEDAAPVAAFYQAACGGEITKRDADSAWLTVGGVTVIFREVAGYRAPTWPSDEVAMQVHLDFFVDGLVLRLRRCCINTVRRRRSTNRTDRTGWSSCSILPVTPFASAPGSDLGRR